MSDEAAMLTCSRCFLGCSRPRLTGAKGAKSIFSGGASAKSAVVQGDCVGEKLFGTSWWSSINVLSIK